MSEGCTHLRDLRQAVTWKQLGDAPVPRGIAACAGQGWQGSTACPAGHMVVLVDPYFCPAFGVDSHED